MLVIGPSHGVGPCDLAECRVDILFSLAGAGTAHMTQYLLSEAVIHILILHKFNELKDG